MKKIIATVASTLLVLFLIALGSGWAPVPSGPPPGPPRPASDRGGAPPTGFYPYFGYHYSGYVVGINPENKTFSYYLGRIQSYGKDLEMDKKETFLIEVDDDTIFFELSPQNGQAESRTFSNLRVGQLVWLKGIEKNGGVVLKIQLSSRID